MPIVSAGGRHFDVDAIAFDKDGTLVDLDATWAPVAMAWIEALAVGDDLLRSRLADGLGVDVANGCLVPDGLIAVGTLAQTQQRTVEIVLGHGRQQPAVDAAVARAVQAAGTAMSSVTLTTLADIPALLEHLGDGGLKCALLTSDDRSAALSFLDALGIHDLMHEVVGGDDVEHPKPHPDGLLRVATSLDVPVERVLMVGDSLTDHGAARNAGAWFVAVGHGSSAALECDAVIAGVAEITVVG